MRCHQIRYRDAEKDHLSHGGTNAFEYEANTFWYLGEERAGPGVRIKKVTNNFTGSDQEITRYIYEEESGRTSGAVVNIPQFAFWCNDRPNYDEEYSIQSYNQAALGSNKGNYVGYGRVVVEKIDPVTETPMGYTAYTYYNSDNYPDVAPTVNEVVYDTDPHTCTPGLDVETQYPFGQ